MNIPFLDIPVLFGFSIEVYFILLVIAVPTFLFWKWLLKKIIKTTRIRQTTTWAATLILTPVIYLGLVMLFLFGISYTPSRNFNQVRWRAEREGRFQMAEDIIESDLFIGKDTSQVKQILGEPSRGMNGGNSYVYDMGFGGGGLGFLFHNLVVIFDNYKVVSVQHQKIRD